MIIVLLCQGLIFESKNPNDPAILFFGVIIVMILCGAIVGSVYLVVTRIVKNNKSMLIPKVAIELLAPETRTELLQVYSSEWSMREGHLEINSDKFVERVNPVQLQEVQSINSQVYKLGKAES
jgi:hypothetical protein